MKYLFTITNICLLSFSLSFGQITRNVPSQYSTIQAAIDASINGDTVLVQPGTYVERINFNGKAIVVSSNFIHSGDTASISNTIIDANYLPNVVTFNHTESNSSQLIGFTIQNGYYDAGSSEINGAGILIDGASPEIRNCIIRDNFISWYGGGICVKNASEPLLSSLILYDNIAQHHGGGIAILGSKPKLVNILLYNNSTGELGGGIYVSSFPRTEIINCTIMNNNATGYSGHYGGGIYTTSGSNILLLNSIVWGNSPNQIDDEFNQIQVVQYSNIQDGYPGTGNINDNPKFISASSNDFRISDYSPSIGSGIDSVFYSGIWYAAPNKDLDLNPRPNPIGSNPDQGAYENSYGAPQHKTLVKVPEDYATIQEAINEVIDGDTILVAPGQYNENINFNGKHIVVSSLFDFLSDSSYILTTIIDGQANGSPVIRFNNSESSSAVLTGFTIRNGLTTNLALGAGIDITSGASPIIRNSIIENNITINGVGGGIRLYYAGNATLNNLIIRNNSAGSGLGGGIYVFASTINLNNSHIYSNQCAFGSAVAFHQTSNSGLPITNCVIDNNSGPNVLVGSDIVLMNCTFFNNQSDIVLSGNSAIINTVIGSDHQIVNDGFVTIKYSLIQDGISSLSSHQFPFTYNWGSEVISHDPIWKNPTINDLRPSIYSPIIGSGTDTLTILGTLYQSPEYDIFNNPRPNPAGSNPDIGAYESPLAHFDLLPPVLSSVSNGAINQPTELQLIWDPVYGATEYRVQLSSDSTFSNTIIDQTNYLDTIISVSSLDYLTTYYWRVNASYPYDTSAWSDVWSFETIIQAPEVPELLLPTNNSFNLQTNLPVIWHPSLRAEVYHLQISTDSLFSTITLEDSLIADTTKSISGLSNNAQYFWRVRAINVGGYSNFSDFSTFKTLLQTPFLQSPTNGSSNVSIDPTFTWDTIPGAANYHIQISLNSSFNQIFMEDSLVTNSTIQIGPLNNSSTYYWRVRGYDGVYTSLFSNPFTFTTIISNPNFPILIAPLDGSVNQPLNTTFVWDTVSSATSYRLQVSVDSLFGSFIFNDSSITTNSRIVNLPNNNQKYFWRVQAKNVGGYSQFSSVWHLITILPAPFLSSIEAGNKEIQISWNQIPLGNVQQTNIYRDIAPNPTNLVGSVPVGLSSFIDTGLTNGITYYYRIKTVSTYGVESEFSNQLSSAPFNSPPVAVALNNVFLPDEGKVLTKQLSFSSSGSFDPDGSIDSVKWYVNDELILIGNDLAYDFSQGTHKVSLIVIDNDGEKDTSIATVTRSMFRNIVNGQVVAGLSLIGDNILYAIVNGDAVYKMDKDGNIDYTLQVGGNLLASSSIANDSSIYIGSTDNNIYAFSNTGTSLWVRALGGAVTTTPTIDIINNRVYVGVSNRNFQFLDRATGNVLGNYFSDAPINTSAVITADNKLFFSTVKGTMYGFDLGNITFPNVTPAWIINSTDTISSSPAIDELGYFYVGTKNGLLKKISMQSGLQGTVVWQANLGGEIIASPVIDESGNIYVGSSNNDFFCVDRTDGDIKWNYTFGGRIKTAAAISDQARIYFGTENGNIYCVDSTGSTLWQYKDSASICNSLLYSDGVLYLGTYGGRLVALYDNEITDGAVMANNIWSTFQGNNQRTGEQADRTTDIKQDESGLPVSFKLSQNYPNPFNPTTKIKFDLPENSTVDLKIYNILGQLITTLVNEEKPAGFYEVDFNATNLPSGVYMYRIQTGSFIETKKMLLLK